MALFILSIAFQNAEASKSDTVWRVKSTVKEPKFTYCFKPNADGKRFDTVSWTMPKGFTLYENECFAPAPIKGVDAFVWEGSVYLPISILDSSFDRQGVLKEVDTVFLFKHDTIKTQVPLSKSIFKSLQLDTADGQQHLKIAIADSVPFDSCLIINLKKGFVICATMKPGEEKRFSFEDLGVDSLNDTCVLFRISPLNGTPLYMTWPTDFQTESDATTAGKKGFAQFMSKFWWVWLIVAVLIVLAIVWWLSHRNKDQNPDNPMLAKLGEIKESIERLKKDSQDEEHDSQDESLNSKLEEDLKLCSAYFERTRQELIDKFDKIDQAIPTPPNSYQTSTNNKTGAAKKKGNSKANKPQKGEAKPSKEEGIAAVILEKNQTLKHQINQLRIKLFGNKNEVSSTLFGDLRYNLDQIYKNWNKQDLKEALNDVSESQRLVKLIEAEVKKELPIFIASIEEIENELSKLNNDDTLPQSMKEVASDDINSYEQLKNDLDALKEVFPVPEDPEDQVSQTQPQTLSETQAQTQTQAQAQTANPEDDSTVPTLFNRFATELDNLLSSVTEAQPEPETVTIAETSSEETAEAETVEVETGTETETKPKSEAKSEPAPLNTTGITKSQLEELKAEFTSLQSEVEQWIKKTNEAHRTAIENSRTQATTDLAEKVREAEGKKDEVINGLKAALQTEKYNTAQKVKEAEEKKDEVINDLKAALKTEKENTAQKVKEAEEKKDEVINDLKAALKTEKENTAKKVKEAEEKKDEVINDLKAALKTEKENTAKKVKEAEEKKDKVINELKTSLQMEKENTAKKVKEAEEKKDKVIDGLKLDQKFYTDNFTRVEFAQAYAKKLQQLFKTVAAIESKANSLMADKMDDPYYLYRAQAKYNQNMGGIKTALASEVDMMARGQLVFNDSQVTKLDKNNPEASLKKYLFNAYLEKYFNAVVVFNESLIGLPYFDQKLKENDVKEFKTFSTQLEKDAEALDVEIATVHIKDRNTFSDVTANPVDVDGFASGEIVSLENCKVWIKGGRKPDSRIKIFVQK